MVDNFSLKNYLTENKLTAVSKKILKEEIFDSLEAAKQAAITSSLEDGTVQHVDKISDNKYKLSDWYDSDMTVYSVEDGRELNEEENLEEMYDEEDLDYDDPGAYDRMRDFGAMSSPWRNSRSSQRR